jgi:hypothetical protein
MPDSTALYTTLYPGGANGEASLLRVSLQGDAEPLRTLSLDGGWVSGWSADGAYVSYVVRGESGNRTVIANADGANPRTITEQPVRGAGWARRGHRYYTILSDSLNAVRVHDPALPAPITFEIDNIEVLRYASLLDDNTFLYGDYGDYGDMNGGVLGVVRFSDAGTVIDNIDVFRTTTPGSRPLRYDAVFAP